MNTIKSLVAFALLLMATISSKANDYALINSYPLLNDMKMAKKQLTLLETMQKTIADHQNNNKYKLNQLKKEFTTIIEGLSNGDKKRKLHGTKLVTLKNQIKRIELIWSQEQNILDSAINNKIYEEEAYLTIKKLSKKIKQLNNLYSESYARYKQNSIMKSLVASYMKQATQKPSRYVLNSIR